jgi:hypothetical protein
LGSSFFWVVARQKSVWVIIIAGNDLCKSKPKLPIWFSENDNNLLFHIICGGGFGEVVIPTPALVQKMIKNMPHQKIWKYKMKLMEITVK